MSYTTEIARLDLSARPYNTNNAWGFAGMSGKAYALPSGGEVRVGWASFRHLPDVAVKKVVTREGLHLHGKAGLDYLAAFPDAAVVAQKARRVPADPGTQTKLVL